MMETLNSRFDLKKLDELIGQEIAPAASAIDEEGEFPRASLDALSKSGFLGLISAVESGGMGESHRARPTGGNAR